MGRKTESIIASTGVCACYHWAPCTSLRFHAENEEMYGVVHEETHETPGA